MYFRLAGYIFCLSIFCRAISTALAENVSTTRQTNDLEKLPSLSQRQRRRYNGTHSHVPTPTAPRNTRHCPISAVRLPIVGYNHDGGDCHKSSSVSLAANAEGLTIQKDCSWRRIKQRRL